MGHSAHRRHTVLHGKVDVTRAGKHSLPSLLLSFLRSLHQPLHDQIVGVVVAPSSRPELGKYAAILQQRASFSECLVLLTAVVPVLIGEHEVGLTCQSQQWDLVQDRFHPQTLDDVVDVAEIIVAASILLRREVNFDLF